MNLSRYHDLHLPEFDPADVTHSRGRDLALDCKDASEADKESIIRRVVTGPMIQGSSVSLRTILDTSYDEYARLTDIAAEDDSFQLPEFTWGLSRLDRDPYGWIQLDERHLPKGYVLAAKVSLVPHPLNPLTRAQRSRASKAVHQYNKTAPGPLKLADCKTKQIICSAAPDAIPTYVDIEPMLGSMSMTTSDIF